MGDQSQTAATEPAPGLEDGDGDEEEEEEDKDEDEDEEEEEAEEEEARLEDCAVASDGWGMSLPKGVDGHNLTILLARRPPFPRKVHWRQAAEKIKASGRQPWRNSFSLTSQERKLERHHEIGTKVFRYILVGFTLVRQEEAFSTVAPSIGLKRANTTDASGWWTAPATIISDAESRGVVMVVAATAEKPLLRVRLFALLEPKHGLCTPYRISGSECFYLPMFRYLNRTSVRVCRKWEAWNVVVRDASFLPPVNTTANDSEDTPQAAEGSDLFALMDLDRPEDRAVEQDAASGKLGLGIVGRKRLGSDTGTRNAQIRERKKGRSKQEQTVEFQSN